MVVPGVNSPSDESLKADEQAYIEARIAKAWKQCGAGIVIPVVYFTLLNWWMAASWKYTGMANVFSLVMGVGFFVVFGLTFHLLFASLFDLVQFHRYRSNPAAFHRRISKDTSWLYAPPTKWPRRFNPKGPEGQVVNQPLRLLHSVTEWTYIERQLAKSKWTLRLIARAFIGYLALLLFWKLKISAPLHGEDGFVAVFAIVFVFVPFVLLFMAIKAIADYRRYNKYQRDHLELLQRHNRTESNIGQT